MVDGTLPGAAGPLAFRLFRPATDGPHPVLAGSTAAAGCSGTRGRTSRCAVTSAFVPGSSWCRSTTGTRPRPGSRPRPRMPWPQWRGWPTTSTSSAGSRAGSPWAGGAPGATWPPSPPNRPATRVVRSSRRPAPALPGHRRQHRAPLVRRERRGVRPHRGHDALVLGASTRTRSTVTTHGPRRCSADWTVCPRPAS